MTEITIGYLWEDIEKAAKTKERSGKETYGRKFLAEKCPFSKISKTKKEKKIVMNLRRYHLFKESK